MLAAAANEGLAVCCASAELFGSFRAELDEALATRANFLAVFLPATLDRPALRKRRRSRRHMCFLPYLFGCRDVETATALKQAVGELVSPLVQH